MNELVKDIVNYFNEVHHFTFTENDILEGIEEVKATIENGEKQSIIDTLQGDYIDTEDVRALELIKRLEAVNTYETLIVKGSVEATFYLQRKYNSSIG